MKALYFLVLALLLSACKENNSKPQQVDFTNSSPVVKTNLILVSPKTTANKDKVRAIIMVANQFETSFQRKYLHKTPYSKHLATVLQQQLNDANVDKNEITRAISTLPDIEPDCLIEIKSIVDSFYKELEKYYKTKNQILYYSAETIPAYSPRKKQMVELENSNGLAKRSLESVISFLKSKDSINICNIQGK
jgi:hypothetical protein